MVPIILGAVASAYADADAQRRRQKLADAMRSYQLGQSAIGQAATQQYLTGSTPEARAAELAKLTGERSTNMQDAVAKMQSTNPAPLAGNLSPDYQRSQATAATTVADRTKRAIAQMATMGAPGEAGVQHGIRFGRAAGVVDATNNAIGNVGNVYSNGINNTVADPMLKLGGNALMAYGAGGGGSSGAATGFEGTQYPGSPETDGGAMTWRAKIANAFRTWGR